ncbi:MAG: pilus assembly protein PilZ, partial [Rhodanobacter sp.]|nr:pilus assembly protein PilZ [Rhodanobacter sp.]
MQPATARQGIISLKIKDAASLYNAYMPFLKHGGLFAATAQQYALGDEVVLLVSLAEETERLSV